MTTKDNKFPLWTTGQANWDSDYDNLVNILERGYHVTMQAGAAVNTGQVLWLNSGGFFFPYNPNSLTINPYALAYTAANSGDTLTALTRGIVRSLAIDSPAVPGQPLFVSTSTPGVIVGSFAGADRTIGYGLDGYGVLFDPGAGQDFIPDGYLRANTLGGVGKARGVSLSAYLDYTLGSSWGAMPVRNGSLWQEVGPSVTSGWVWTSNGSGVLPGYAAAPGGGGASDWVLIGSHVVVGSEQNWAFATTLNYRHLLVKISGASFLGATNDKVNMQLNADSGANYDSHLSWMAGAANNAIGNFDYTNANFFRLGFIAGNSAYVGAAADLEVHINNYVESGSFDKRFFTTGNFFVGLVASSYLGQHNAGVWKNNSSVSTLFFLLDSGSWFFGGTTFSVYGIRG